MASRTQHKGLAKHKGIAAPYPAAQQQDLQMKELSTLDVVAREENAILLAAGGRRDLLAVGLTLKTLDTCMEVYCTTHPHCESEKGAAAECW